MAKPMILTLVVFLGKLTVSVAAPPKVIPGPGPSADPSKAPVPSPSGPVPTPDDHSTTPVGPPTPGDHSTTPVPSTSISHSANMANHDPVDAPDWAAMLENAASNNDQIKLLEGDIAAGNTVWPKIGGYIGGVIGLIPQIASIFHTSHNHSDTFVKEITQRGFDQFALNQSGPLIYQQVPFTAMMNGKQVKPLEMMLDELLKAHLSDVPTESDREDLQNYVMMVANGWAGGDATITSQAIHYTSKNGGGSKAVRFISNANLAEGHASVVFWSTTTDFKFGDRLLLHKVTDTGSNILKDSSYSRYEIQRIPETMSTDDTLALSHFFDIMAYNSIASSMQMCDLLADKCALPNLKPHGTNILDEEEEENAAYDGMDGSDMDIII